MNWTLYIDEDQIPHFVIDDKGEQRIPNVDEAKRAIEILNSEGSTTIKLYCVTETCPGKGGWIERTRKDAEKHSYACDVCGKAMTR